MKKFRALLSLSLRSMLLTSAGKSRGKRKKAASGLGVMVVMAFLALYISGVYSVMLMEVLAPVGMESMVFIYMGMVALLGGLLYTTFAVKGVVFGGKDNDLLLSMPVSSTLLAASRVSAIYLENLVFSAFVLLPAGVACAIMTESGGGRTASFWVRLLLAALLLPLLDTALSVGVGALVAFASAKLSRGKALGQNLFMAFYLVLVFYFSFSINGMMAELAADAAGIKASLTWALPMVWMGDGILGSWGLLLAFGACCILPFLVMIVLLGKNYRRAVTAFQGQSARGDYRLSAQRGAGQRRALLRKEARRFFGTPTYFWNAGLGLIFMLVMGVAALVKRKELLALAEALGGSGLVLPLCCGALGFCLSTVAITASSVSLEGKCFWILREAPVKEKTLLWVKVGFQLLLSIPCTLAASLCFCAALSLPAWQWVVLFVTMVLFALWQAVFGLLMGLAFPKLDAANETVVIKQSLSVLLAMFVPMVALLVGGLLWWLGCGISGVPVLPMVWFGVLAAVCGGILAKKGPQILRTL